MKKAATEIAENRSKIASITEDQSTKAWVALSLETDDALFRDNTAAALFRDVDCDKHGPTGAAYSKFCAAAKAAGAYPSGGDAWVELKGLDGNPKPGTKLAVLWNSDGGRVTAVVYPSMEAAEEKKKLIWKDIWDSMRVDDETLEEADYSSDCDATTVIWLGAIQ